jgi:hypothetical protein
MVKQLGETLGPSYLTLRITTIARFLLGLPDGVRPMTSRIFQHCYWKRHRYRYVPPYIPVIE